MSANDPDRRLPEVRGHVAAQAAIFDLDGTLVDSEPINNESARHFLADYGIDIEGIELTGMGAADMFRLLEAVFPGSPLHSLSLEERIKLNDEHCLRGLAGKLRAFEPMKALAAALLDRGLRLAVASGSSLAVVEAALSAVGIRGLFSAVVSSSEVGRGKPAPDVFLEAARRLGAEASHCLVFEDTRFGVSAAAAAAMFCVAFPAPDSRPHHPDFRLADLVVEEGAGRFDVELLLWRLECAGLLQAIAKPIT